MTETLTKRATIIRDISWAKDRIQSRCERLRDSQGELDEGRMERLIEEDREKIAQLNIELIAIETIHAEVDAASPQTWDAICAISRCTNPSMIEAVTLVLAECTRQQSVEGFTTAHDDTHTDGALAAASAEYALHASFADERDTFPPGKPSDIWPWEPEWWKPTDPRSDMVKSVALGLAEVERLIRAEVAA